MGAIILKALVALVVMAQPSAPTSELALFRALDAETGEYTREFALCSPRVYDAQIDLDEYSREMVLNVQLGPNGRLWLAETTAKNVGQQMHIVIGDEIVSSPIVNEPITGGTMVLSGLSIDEATRFQKAMLRPCKMMEASTE